MVGKRCADNGGRGDAQVLGCRVEDVEVLAVTVNLQNGRHITAAVAVVRGRPNGRKRVVEKNLCGSRDETGGGREVRKYSEAASLDAITIKRAVKERTVRNGVEARRHGGMGMEDCGAWRHGGMEAWRHGGM